MAEYNISSQHKIWKFRSRQELEACREYTNLQARKLIASRAAESSETFAPPVSCYACFHKERQLAIDYPNANTEGPWELGKHKFITAAQEKVLVDFYLAKLPALVGPTAHMRRLRRDSKVVATAAMLLQRFYVSNSVLFFDPKVMMVASVFLATKVEDAMVNIRELEEGTQQMNAPVKTPDIVAAEVHLVAGVHFDLLCFHPFKTLVALTEDVRTLVKKQQQQSTSSNDTPLPSPDWKTIYDKARLLLDTAVVHTDVALVYTPSHLGLASLWHAAEGAPLPWTEYFHTRFPQHDTQPLVQEIIPAITVRLAQVYQDDVEAVKSVHKQLKKVRVWEGDTAASSKKKKKKRSEGEESTAKRQKVAG